MCNKSDFPFFHLLLPFSPPHPTRCSFVGEKGWTKAIGSLLVYLTWITSAGVNIIEGVVADITPNSFSYMEIT